MVQCQALLDLCNVRLLQAKVGKGGDSAAAESLIYSQTIRYIHVLPMQEGLA